MIIDSRRMTGWKFDRVNGYLEVFVRGTSMAYFDDATNDLKLLTNGMSIAGNSLFADKITYSDQLVHGAVTTETITGNKTLDVEDTGKIFLCATDGVNFTLRSMTQTDMGCGYTVTLVNTGADGVVDIKVTPATGDKIMGIGLTAADEKHVINTQGTAKKGDYVTLMADGTLGYYVVASAGTWTREV